MGAIAKDLIGVYGYGIPKAKKHGVGMASTSALMNTLKINNSNTSNQALYIYSARDSGFSNRI